jgi:hypothetical protein
MVEHRLSLLLDQGYPPAEEINTKFQQGESTPCGGHNSRWYQAALRQKAGRIIAAGLTKEVTFEPVEGAINDRIDEAYRAKYGDSPYLEPMVVARARAATVKVMPARGQDDA